MILTGDEIRKRGIVKPCEDKVLCNLSYGLEPIGYTLSIDNEFMFPINFNYIFDPMNPEKTKKYFHTVKKDVFTLKPKSFVLAKAREYIEMPKDVTGIALTKSTYARIGVFANITPLDPNWRGYLTIEIANLGRNSVKIYANYGIAMVIFNQHEETSGYVGKYQNLKDIAV